MIECAFCDNEAGLGEVRFGVRRFPCCPRCAAHIKRYDLVTSRRRNREAMNSIRKERRQGRAKGEVINLLLAGLSPQFNSEVSEEFSMEELLDGLLEELTRPQPVS